MVRIAGILCGSALAISSLIVLLGVPEFLPEPAGLRNAEPEVLLPEILEQLVEVVEPEPIKAFEASIAAAELMESTAFESDVVPAPQEEQVAKVTAEQAVQTAEEHWYAFWSPFRSELAAKGFVAQLQRSTGIDYRVVQSERGAYEVAFAFRDDADIAAHLATISAATGLELPGE